MANVMIHVGLGDYVSSAHSVAVIQPGSITGRRRVSAARRLNQYIDCSHGKGIRSYVLLDDNTVIASHITTRTLAERYACQIGEGGDAETNSVSQSTQVSYLVRPQNTDDDDDDLPFADDDFDGDPEQEFPIDDEDDSYTDDDDDNPYDE